MSDRYPLVLKCIDDCNGQYSLTVGEIYNGKMINDPTRSIYEPILFYCIEQIDNGFEEVEVEESLFEVVSDSSAEVVEDNCVTESEIDMGEELIKDKIVELLYLRLSGVIESIDDNCMLNSVEIKNLLISYCDLVSLLRKHPVL